MRHALWIFLGRPLLDWLIVSLVFLALQKFLEARALAAQSADRAIHLPVGAKMAEVSLQVPRADGTKEAPQTYRTYKNPLRRWAWALQTAFSKGA